MKVALLVLSTLLSTVCLANEKEVFEKAEQAYKDNNPVVDHNPIEYRTMFRETMLSNLEESLAMAGISGVVFNTKDIFSVHSQFPVIYGKSHLLACEAIGSRDLIQIRCYDLIDKSRNGLINIWYGHGEEPPRIGTHKKRMGLFADLVNLLKPS